MRGYTMPLADSSRAAWVSALPRKYSELRSAVSPALSRALGPPVAIAVENSSANVLYHFRNGAIVEAGRVQTGLAAAPPRDSMLVALPPGAAIGDELHPWQAGYPRSLDPGAPVGRILTAGLIDNAWITVRQNASETTVDAITIRRINFEGTLAPQMRVDAGYGCAAISASGSIGLAFNHGSFVVVNAASLHERLEIRRSPAPYLVSALPGGWGLVSAIEDSDAKTPPVEQRARVTGVPGHEIRSTWRSHVECLADDGSTRWSVDVPFTVLQPPVDGGGGRCYLVGKGIAALDGGRLIWHKAANTRITATCFGNGALALATGSTVRIISRDGRLQQTLAVSDRSPIVTLPTVAPDGAIYIGTITGVHVAR